jgi:hypothetical protein
VNTKRRHDEKNKTKITEKSSYLARNNFLRLAETKLNVGHPVGVVAVASHDELLLHEASKAPIKGEARRSLIHVHLITTANKLLRPNGGSNHTVSNTHPNWNLARLVANNCREKKVRHLIKFFLFFVSYPIAMSGDTYGFQSRTSEPQSAASCHRCS